MARHERQPNKADSQASNVRKPRTFSSTATVGTSKSNNSVNATNRDEKLRTKAPGTSYRTAPEDPFQIAISQGVQDGDTWVHNHVKNLIRRSIIVAVIGLRRHGRENIAENARTECHQRLQRRGCRHERFIFQGFPAQGKDCRRIFQHGFLI